MRLALDRICCSLAVAMLASTTLASADLAFTPPNGWNSGGGRVGGKAVNVWRAPKGLNGFAQDISVVQDRYPGQLAQYVALNVTSLQQRPGLKVTQSDVLLCGGIPGKMLSFSAMSGGRSVQAQQLYTGIDGMYYVLTYARTTGEAIAPDAVRSLTTACPKASAIAPVKTQK